MSDIKIYDKIIYKKIEEIKPYENNARVNTKSINALVKAIQKVGFNVPIVVDKNGVIVKGHTRYEALKKMKVDLIPCIVIDGNEKDIAEERLVDNKLSELAEWDEDKLKYELKEMSFDLSKFDIELPKIKSDVTQVKDVTNKDVAKAEQKLVGSGMVTAQEQQSLIELHCPNCGETFFVDYKEVMKYAD